MSSEFEIHPTEHFEEVILSKKFKHTEDSKIEESRGNPQQCFQSMPQKQEEEALHPEVVKYLQEQAKLNQPKQQYNRQEPIRQQQQQEELKQQKPYSDLIDPSGYRLEKEINKEKEDKDVDDLLKKHFGAEEGNQRSKKLKRSEKSQIKKAQGLKKNKETEIEFNKEIQKERSNSLPIIPINTLPSKFIAYPSGAQIGYRPFTYGEISKYSQMSETIINNPRRIIKYQLGGMCANFDVRDITYYDFLYIGHLRRLSSFDDAKAKFKANCPSCGGTVEKVVSFFELPFVDLDFDCLPIKTTISGVELHFGLLTIGDILGLADEYAFGAYPLACSVRNMPFEEAMKVLNSAQGEDIDTLEYLDKMVFHGLKPVPVKCNNSVNSYEMLFENDTKEEVICGHEFNVEADNPLVLIVPFRKHKDVIRDRISFG